MARLDHVGHIRGVARDVLVRALHDVLVNRGLVPKANAEKHGDTQIVVTKRGPWLSFAEGMPGRLGRLESARPEHIVWSALSSTLEVPILEVCENKTSTTFTVWSAGRTCGKVVARGGPKALDASALARFAPNRAVSLASIDLDIAMAGDHQFVAVWLAQEVGLDAAILLGQFDSTLLVYGEP